jgi:hypothetical protein
VLYPKGCWVSVGQPFLAWDGWLVVVSPIACIPTRNSHRNPPVLLF